MKMKRLMLALLLMVMTMAVSAATSETKSIEINGESLGWDENGALIPPKMNEKFIKDVFWGSNTELKDAEIIITEVKDYQNYTVALLVVDDKYTYVVTYKPKGGIIDGALLLCKEYFNNCGMMEKKEDIIFAANALYDRGTMMFDRPSELSLKDNIITVTRNYTSFVNYFELGGKEVKELGSVTFIYHVDQSGRITRTGPTYHSKWTTAPNTSLPHDKRFPRETTETEYDRCQTLSAGWDVISCYTTPASEKIETGGMEAAFNYYIEAGASQISEIIESNSIIWANAIIWQERLIYRDPQSWLLWMAENPESESANAFALSGADFKKWVKKEIKSIKDKNNRKVLESLLKKYKN